MPSKHARGSGDTMSHKGLHEFLAALFASEAGGRHDVENKHGYIGKYQFGEDALIDLGYYQKDGSANRDGKRFRYDWIGTWTGKHGATSKEVFLSSPDIQDQAAREWVGLLCKRLHHHKLERYVGQTMAGVEVTESGIIAAAHLKGFGNSKRPGVIAFLKSNGQTDPADAFGTQVSRYMRKFSGFALGCCAQCAVQVLDRDKAPVAGLGLKIVARGKEIFHGITNAQGQIPFVGGFSAGHELTVLVRRMEGGYKEITQFVARHTPSIVTLTSPKLMLEAALLPHAGPAGAHTPETVQRARAAQRAGQRATRTEGVHRNGQGNPVQVIEAPADLPPLADRLQALQDILLRNAAYGSKSEPLSGPAAVVKSRRGEAISVHIKSTDVSLGRCYKYVKVALQGSGMVSRYLAGEHAKDAGPELEREGFRNLLERADHGLEGPMDAPVGAVIVYDTTDGSPHGHIEVRAKDERGKQVVASDYISLRPRTQTSGVNASFEGRGRKVSGIWVKP